MAQYTEFINPYHFAPLGGPVKRDKKEKLSEVKDKRYTGKIQVSLKTRTPLFIPDTHGRRREESSHKTYEFFSYDGVNPVIPGSSLNGMLRNVFETVTNSCLSVVDMEEKPVRRTNEYYKPGLLYRDEQGNMTLYEAAKATVKPGQRPDRQGNKPVRTADYQEGCGVRAKIRRAGRETLAEDVCLPEELPKGREKLWKTGYYFKGEPGVNKKNTWGSSCNAYVFYFFNENKKTVKNRLTETSLEIQQLEDVLKSYEDFAAKKSVQKGHQGYQEYKRRLKIFLREGNGYFPVHFSRAAGHLYLSPACITKEVYYTSLKEILKKQEEHHTCDNIHSLCPACRLFGMVGNGVSKEKDYLNAWAGSVRVQDAFLKEKKNLKDIYMDKITLMELAGPRKSSTEFYLQKPEGTEGQEVLSWTYDYYMAKEKNGKLVVAAYTPRLSGRKFYWHHIYPNLPKEFVEVTDRNCTVTPIRNNVEFTFPVYFEKISERQLEQLIWLCNISSRTEKGKAKYGYKIGKGKPLGLGSVELTVEDVQIRCLKKNGEINYHLESFEEILGKNYQGLSYESVGFGPEVKEAFLRLCEFEAVGKTPVTYPVENRQSVRLAYNGYKWFGNNHFHINGGNGKITKREELVFQQYMQPLTGGNTLKVNINTRDKYDHLCDGRAKANNNYPAVGSKVWAVIKKVDESYINVRAEAKTVAAFDIKVKKEDKKEYTVGSKVYTELTGIFFKPGSVSYEGKDVTERKRQQ